MTRTESKLRKAGFNTEIDAGSIVINSTREVEVYATDADGDHDWDTTEELKDKVNKVLGWGGFKCGYGGWILQKDYDHAASLATLADQLGAGAYT